MSKLYNLYQNLKNENNEIIYLFKSGIFYIALSDDAIFLSNKFNLKLTNLNNCIVKCGFPISSEEKYINLLKANNIDFKLIDISSNTIYSLKEYELNSNILDLITLINSVDCEHLSISEAYHFIDTIKEKSKNIKI